MKKTFISGLALALVIGLSSVAQAQEDKMTEIGDYLAKAGQYYKSNYYLYRLQ